MKLTTALLASPLAVLAQDTFSQPVIWQDLPDLDVIRAGDKFYITSATSHYSPGAPIIRSQDLVNWEYWGHAVTELEFPPASAYDLDGGNRYGKGISSSCLGYRETNKRFYWAGCVDSDSQTFVYTSTAADGPWKQESVVDRCYEDCGMHFDADDNLYIVYGRGDISLAQLSPDDLKEKETKVVWQSTPEISAPRSTRVYQKDEMWYIIFAEGDSNQHVLRSDGAWGPYERRELLNSSGTPVKGASSPQQGGFVSTQDGDWYYMALVSAGPGGNLPVLAPINWENNWPEVVFSDGAWASEYPLPLAASPVKAFTGKDEFSTLGAQYEWNHDVDNSAWFIEYEGLQLRPSTVTDDFFKARNTLTHRILGPKSTVTAELNTTFMIDGDRAGLALLRYRAGWVGVAKDDGALKAVMVNGIEMEEDSENGWQTVNKGEEIASEDFSVGTVWLRVEVDISPESEDHTGVFSVSTDGSSFQKLGEAHSMDDTSASSFPAYRYGIFSYSASQLGGRPTFASLDISQ